MSPLREEFQSGEATRKPPAPRGVSSGRTLASLSSEEPGNLDRILRIFADILRLLDSIHSNGLQHDSLAPNSIRLDHNDKPEIRTRSYALEKFDTLGFANPKYVLPESFREGPENNSCTASDCYALGFMLYELLLGRRGFRAQFAAVETGDAVAWLRWHADPSRKIIPLAELIPNFPRSVSNLILDMTEKDPQCRADVGSILRTLQCAGQATIVSSAPGTPKRTFFRAKIKSFRPPFRLVQIAGFFQRFKQNTLARGNAHSQRSEKDEEARTGLDKILQRIKERFGPANKLAEAARADKKRTNVGKALRKWAIIQAVHPSFTSLKFNLHPLMRLRREQVESQGMSGESGGTFSSARTKRFPILQQLRLEKRYAKWIGAIGLALALLICSVLAHRYLIAPKPSGAHLLPVKLQADIADTLFTVDGRPSLSSSVNLAPGTHQAEATAAGYKSVSKKFTVPDSGSASVAFILEPLLPSLHLTTALKGAQYVLDGNGPIALDGGLTNEHLLSGTHTLKIMKRGTRLFSLQFTAAPQRLPEINAHTERGNISVLIMSAFEDSAKVYATPDWTVSLGNGSPPLVAPNGLELHAQSTGSSEVVAASVDGEIQKLSIAQSRAPVLNISVKSLPERIPVTILANVSDPVVVVNGRRSDARMVNGRGVLTIFPGKYRITLKHRGYYDSPSRQIAVDRPAAQPIRIRFVLRPFNRRVLGDTRH